MFCGAPQKAIYDEDGTEVDYFTIESAAKLTADAARRGIERMIRYSREEK